MLIIYLSFCRCNFTSLIHLKTGRELWFVATRERNLNATDERLAYSENLRIKTLGILPIPQKNKLVWSKGEIY